MSRARFSRQKNFVNKSCLSHRDKAFDIGIDKILYLCVVFEFPTLDYVVWTHFQEKRYRAVPSHSTNFHKMAIMQVVI